MENDRVSRVIKKKDADHLNRHMRALNLVDYVAEARLLVDRAREQATELMHEARLRTIREHDEQRRRGYDQGYAEGLKQGRETGMTEAHREALRLFEERHATAVRAFDEAAAALRNLRTDLRVRAQRDLLDFALALVERLTLAIGATRNQTVVENLGRALEFVQSRTDVTVWVHPTDRATLEEFAPAVWAAANADRAVNIREDETIAPGGCRLSDGTTEVDATLHTQIENLVCLLTGKGDQ